MFKAAKTIRSTVRKLTFATFLTLALAPISNSASALPDSPTPEQRKACTGDVMRLCSAAIPDRDRVVSCMLQKKESVSNRCRVAVGF